MQLDRFESRASRSASGSNARMTFERHLLRKSTDGGPQVRSCREDHRAAGTILSPKCHPVLEVAVRLLPASAFATRVCDTLARDPRAPSCHTLGNAMKLSRTGLLVPTVAAALVSLLGLGVSAAQEDQRSTSTAQEGQRSASTAREGQRPTSERDTSRQRVRPGEAPSSRREPSRIRNEDEPGPTVQNRAPEIINRPAVPVPPIQRNSGG